MSIRARSVTVAYGEDAPVVRGLDVDVASNEWLGVLGPNGAGKSTFLKALAGLIEFDGAIALDDEDLRTLHRKVTARTVAYVPQEPVMPPGMRVFEYVLLGRTPHLSYLGTESRDDVAVAERSLEALDVAEFAERTVDDLSGGERQRGVLARALTQQASILLLDEPTSALDIGHRQHALELIGAIRTRRPITIVTAMHDLTLAGQYADRLVLLADGEVVADGLAADVLTADTIATHYDASVEIIELDGGGVAVVPVRGGT